MNFSDESKFNLIDSDHRGWVWRRPGDAYQERYTLKTKKYGGGSVMVWGCITYHGVGRLHRITGIMTAATYIQILQEHYLGTLADLHINPQLYFFQQDNDSKHSAKVTKEWFQTNSIHTLPWPSQSPDLNIIEHVWDYLKQQIRSHQPQPQDKEELWKVLKEEWAKIPLKFIRKLYDSLPKRVAEVKKARGGNTSY